MTQEEKELLIKDLCARIPYEVQCEIGGLQHGPYTFTGNDVEDLIAGRTFKPYLRHMSSMTEEERNFVNNEFFHNSDNFQIDDVGEMYTESQPFESIYTLSLKIQSKYFDWLNKKMFDYRGLIEKGLALEAPKEMYNTKTE